MHAWVEQLARGQRVLDLGAGAGSLKSTNYPCSLFFVDNDASTFSEPAATNPQHRIAAMGMRLPFADRVFDLVICNHVLEHVVELDGTLREISRVLKPGGRFYVSVPNGYGLCDGIYRFLFKGGDHVNRFRRAALVERIEKSGGGRLTAWQKLYSSFAYLSRAKSLDRAALREAPARLRWFAALPRFAIKSVQAALYLATRCLDTCSGSTLSVYGWALYFESAGAAVREIPAFVNVCFVCGSGHPACELNRIGLGRFRCPTCDSVSPYFPPFRGAE